MVKSVARPECMRASLPAPTYDVLSKGRCAWLPLPAKTRDSRPPNAGSCCVRSKKYRRGDSFATASLPRSLNFPIPSAKLCLSKQGLLTTSFLCLFQVVKIFDSQFCPTCPSQSVWRIAHLCPTIKANFPQRCRVLRLTLVLLTNCLLLVCSSIDLLIRPRL